MSKCSWMITVDHTGDTPRNLKGHEHILGDLSPGEIRKHPEACEFRMYDDDDNLYYEGMYVGPDDHNMFSPLDDFGEPNAGCVVIEYWHKASQNWEML